MVSWHSHGLSEVCEQVLTDSPPEAPPPLTSPQAIHYEKRRFWGCHRDDCSVAQETCNLSASGRWSPCLPGLQLHGQGWDRKAFCPSQKDLELVLVLGPHKVSLVYPIAAFPTEAPTRVPAGWIRRDCGKTDPSVLLLTDSKIGSLHSDSWAQINRSILSSLHLSTISCLVMAIFL